MLRRLASSACSIHQKRLLQLSTNPSQLSSVSPTHTVRFYRGDTGEAQQTLTQNEEELVRIGKPRYDAIRERHIRAVRVEDLSSQNVQDLKADFAKKYNEESSVVDDYLELEVRKKRLIYRSKQRGWLEVDILLGTWASENVEKLATKDELDQYEAFVNMETIDIYNVITLRLDVPDSMKREGGQGVVERIQEWCRNNPLGKVDPEAYKKLKEGAKLI